MLLLLLLLLLSLLLFCLYVRWHKNSDVVLGRKKKDKWKKIKKSKRDKSILGNANVTGNAVTQLTICMYVKSISQENKFFLKSSFYPAASVIRYRQSRTHLLPLRKPICMRDCLRFSYSQYIYPLFLSLPLFHVFHVASKYIFWIGFNLLCLVNILCYQILNRDFVFRRLNL